MARSSDQIENLSRRLVKISQHEGVFQLNLHRSLDRSLRHACGITDQDSPDIVRIKLTQLLTTLTARLNRDQDKRIAKYCFNIIDESSMKDMMLVTRQDILASTFGPSRRTIFNRLRMMIIPEFARYIFTDLVASHAS